MTRKLSLHTLALWAALPMARTAQVESRLRMILKPNVSRRALTRRAVLLALLPATAAVGIIAALRPAVRAQSNATGSPASWKQTLPNGATVEVLGVSDPHLSPAVWWKPDGTPLAAPPIDPENTVTSTAKQQRIFAVRITPPPGSTEDPGTTFDAHGMSVGGYGRGMLTSKGRHLPDVSIILTVPQADTAPARADVHADTVPAQTDLRCGAAAGAWQTQATQVEDFAEAAGSSGNVIFSRLSEIKGSTAITVTTTLASTVAQWRVLAVDTTGKVYTSGGRGRVGGNGVQQETCVFEGLPVGKVKEVRFQTRPYQWAEFKNIALHPSQH